jgi:aminoglycoside 3-N-acetyltransferase I
MHQNAKSVEFRQLAAEDLSTFHLLIDLFNLVFEEENPTVGSEAGLLRLLNRNDFIVIVAIDENKVVGGLTAYELPMYYSDSSEIFLYDLAVQPEYQRMGVGKGLLQSLKKHCLEHGIKEFFVMAHEEDEHAIEFYHATGGKNEKVVNFVYDTDEE